MFFLLRAAFWFSLVLLVLPFSVGSDEQGQSVNPIQALLAARDAVGDIAGMCERKPDVCETGKAAVHTISVRAKETAKIAADMLDDQPAKQAEAAPAGPSDTTTITGRGIPTPSARPDPNN